MSKLKRNLVVVGIVLTSVTAVWAFQLGSRTAEEWADRLEREERVQGLKIEEVVAGLSLKPGDTVADIGAGNGRVLETIRQGYRILGYSLCRRSGSRTSGYHQPSGRPRKILETLVQSWESMKIRSFRQEISTSPFFMMSFITSRTGRIT